MTGAKTITLAQLTRNAEAIVDDIDAEQTVYHLKRPGRRTVMLMTLESWEATLEFIEQHPNWRAELEQNRRDYEAGLCVPWAELRKELGLEEPRRHAARSRPARGASRSRRTGRR